MDKGAEMNLQVNFGVTALIIASQNGYQEIVELLLDSGANLKLVTNHLESALSATEHNRHKKIVKLLKVAGAKRFGAI